jgi:hypothetical protein
MPRIRVRVPGRIAWRDRSGTFHTARVVTRDVGPLGVFIECDGGPLIPLYRLVELTLDRGVRRDEHLPPVLRGRGVWSAVYRVEPLHEEAGRSVGYALRLLVEPERDAERDPRRQVTSLSAWTGKCAARPVDRGAARPARVARA